MHPVETFPQSLRICAQHVLGEVQSLSTVTLRLTFNPLINIKKYLFFYNEKICQGER